MADISMQLEIRRDGDIAVIETKGYIDSAGGSSITSAYNKLFDEGIRRFVVNIAQRKFINSMGVLHLLEIAAQAQSSESTIAFCCATPTIAKSFEIMGLMNFASVYDTEDEALQAYKSMQ
jgi:anti-anti-sigma factor